MFDQVAQSLSGCVPQRSLRKARNLGPLADTLSARRAHTHTQGYAEFFLPDYPTLRPMISEYSNGRDSLGPYWEQPGRSIVEQMVSALRASTWLY